MERYRCGDKSLVTRNYTQTQFQSFAALFAPFAPLAPRAPLTPFASPILFAPIAK